MFHLRILQKKLRALVLPFIALLCLGYLGYHTLHGDRGLEARIGLSERLDALKRERAALKAQHSWLVHKASLLEAGAVPCRAGDDAAHIAIAAANSVDYLVTCIRSASGGWSGLSAVQDQH